jgi:hypothetical protein
MAEVLDPAFLAEHGIGAIVFTETARTAAVAGVIATTQGITPTGEGSWTTYLVETPTTLVSFDGGNALTSKIDGSLITATGAGAGGTAKIRMNWYPRWRATVNDKPAPIVESTDGYMEVPIPIGDVEIELHYVVDSWDWLARMLCFAGAAALVAGLLPIRFWLMPGKPGLPARRDPQRDAAA